MNNPLTKGEKALAKFLYENLSDNWEIYVQPFLNGDRPDIVILNPQKGNIQKLVDCGTDYENAKFFSKNLCW
jgi:hypothetical protein